MLARALTRNTTLATGEGFLFGKEEMNICDFCSTPNPEWSYPTKSFKMDLTKIGLNIDYYSEGSWAACEYCHGLIEKGLQEALAHHSAVTLIESKSLPRAFLPEIERQIFRLHRNFWRYRQGPARRIKD